MHTIAKVLNAGAGYQASQGPDYQPGVSAENAGALDLWLGVVTIPPGKRTKAHVHERHESAFYMLSGESIELWSGEGLAERAVAHPGDYIYVPKNVVHVAVNRSTVPAVFVGARNEATAQESVVLFPELDAKVP